MQILNRTRERQYHKKLCILNGESGKYMGGKGGGPTKQKKKKKRNYDTKEILNENKRQSEQIESPSEPRVVSEKELKQREATSRSLKRNTAILEDLSTFLKNAGAANNNNSIWSDGEDHESSVGTLSQFSSLPFPSPSTSSFSLSFL